MLTSPPFDETKSGLSPTIPHKKATIDSSCTGLRAPANLKFTLIYPISRQPLAVISKCQVFTDLMRFKKTYSFPFAFYAFSCDFHKIILVSKQDGYMIKEKNASHFPCPHLEMGEGAARAKVFYITALPL